MLTVLQGGSLDYARDDDGAKRYQNSAALHYFLRRTFPAEPVEPTEPAPLFRKQSKGSTPQGLTLNPAFFIFFFTFFDFLLL